MSSSPAADKPVRVQRRGLMLVLSSPSGAGKSTIANRLLTADDNLSMSISVTTRPKRPSEVDGREYQFVSEQRFEDMVRAEVFLEHATVFGNRYGTPKAPVEDALSAGRDILFDIDWQGAQQVSQHASQDVVTVFILPPSTGELERRLHSRAEDSDAVVKARMAKAADEITHWDAYDYIIINEDLERAVESARAILVAERARKTRQVNLRAFVDSILSR